MALMNTPQLSEMLSTEAGRLITTRQIGMWFLRRERNGFPEPEAERADSQTLGYQDKGVKLKYLWDSEKVKKWHKNYVPAPGGRKPAKPPVAPLKTGMAGGRYVARTERKK